MEKHASALKDQHGRTVRYLRISVTDRCNLCCRYCRDERTEFTSHDLILRYEEIEEVIGVAAELGVTKLRFTGGEPFARKGFLEFLHRVHDKFPGLALKLTTNGTLLDAAALSALKEMGVAVNLSLDTLKREKFARITGRDLFGKVMDGMHAMMRLGIPLKINAVAMRGVNDDEILSLASLALDKPVDVRFIEFMPMGESTIWNRRLFMPAEDILARLAQRWEPVPIAKTFFDASGRPHPLAEENGPARLWKLRSADGTLSNGSFGLITPVTHGFCLSCNRLRLTADGSLRTCLFDDKEYPVRDILRRDGIEAVRKAMVDAVAHKPVGAEILAGSTGPVARKGMSAIGG